MDVFDQNYKNRDWVVVVLMAAVAVGMVLQSHEFHEEEKEVL